MKTESVGAKTWRPPEMLADAIAICLRHKGRVISVSGPAVVPEAKKNGEKRKK